MLTDIQHYAGIDGTPAVALALRGRLECVESAGEQAVGLHYSYNAIVASVAALPVGVIVWFEQKEQHRLWLQLGYVLPQYRGYGIYSRLWTELLDKARELKAAEIWSGTAIGNTHLRAIAKKQGRVEVAVSLKFEVPAHG